MSAPGPAVSFDPVATALEAGREQWGDSWQPALAASAPGRVELLGNHIDYNGGPVLAAAIDRRAVVLSEPGRSAGSIEIIFADTGDHGTIDLGSLGWWQNNTSEQEPLDYARGVAATLLSRKVPVRASRLSVSSAVPAGIGVSSSAALCVALALAMSERPLGNGELITIARDAEHRAGTPCGLMDQSASVAGGVILFHGLTTTYESLQPYLGEMAFLVVDSGVRRVLAHSSYPVRVEECAWARAFFEASLMRPVDFLAEVGMDEYERVASTAKTSEDQTLMRRVRHIVDEKARVLAGITALDGSDWGTFGALMTESGRSSATHYEISHPVVEDLVARLLSDPAVLGARMMGGGEGGSLIALAEQGASVTVRSRIEALVNQDVPEGEPRREVFVFNFAQGASIDRFDQ